MLRLARDGAKNEEYAAKIAVRNAYAQALRELPEQAGAPWDGGGENSPWPEAPET